LSRSAPSIERIQKVKAAASKSPVIVGSGVNKINAKDLLRYADGVIVGTSLKTDNKVSSRKVSELVNAIVEWQ
jgi:predicted TIM-barrel enzyme